jgi:tRNA (cytidine/uridine-2'-O-)-methyltransferase
MQPKSINIVLVEPQIPHNTGAIGRLCVGLGAALHLVEPLGFDISDRAVKRAGLDYWEHLDISVHSDWDAFLEATTPAVLCFASTRGKRDLFECQLPAGVFIVFGNETRGLPPDFYERYAEQLFKIPQPGEHARSINLANAASVAIYEAYRQQTAE